jgi:hypothetical protein
MKNLHTKALVWLLVLMSMTGCSLAFDDIAKTGSFTPEVAVPLLETQYRLGDLMKGLGANDYLQIRPDGQYEMQFNGKYTDPQMLNIFSSLTDVITIPTSGEPFLIAPFPAPAGMKIDSMDMKKGVFQWTMENFNVGDIEVTITFYSLTKDNVPYTRTFMIPKNLGRPITLGMDMEGWRLKSDANGKIIIGYTATMGGLPVKVSDFYYQLYNLVPQKAFGYFGQIPISLKAQNLAFDFFKNWKQGGELRFADPSVTVTVDNGFGFPVNIKSDLADALKKDGTRVAITGVLKEGVNINFPSMNEMGQTKQTPIVLNKQSSNIVDIFNASPTSISLALNVLANPDASNKNAGFILDNAGVKFKIDAKIPLIASAKNFIFSDTMALNLSDFTEITDAEFKIITDNLLPLDIGMQLYFTNDSYGIIDSLTSNTQALILKAAAVFNGQVVNSTANTTLINIDAARFNNIKAARKVIIKSILTTATDGTVPVYLKADQKFTVRMGVKAKTKI